MPSIALAMIADAKDEQERGQLRVALASAAPAVTSGVVVLDSRSESEADDLVREFGFTPIRREWDGNFSNARNFAAKQCNGADWLLILDRDEVLHMPTRVPEIVALAEQHECDFHGTIVKSTPDDGGPPNITPQKRLHRNTPEVVWKYAAHNQQFGLEKGLIARPSDPFVTTSYAGKLHEKNYGRTIPILESMLESDDEAEVRHATYYLARTYIGIMEYPKAIPYCEQIIDECASDPDYYKAHKWLWQARGEGGDMEGAWSALEEGLSHFPYNPDLLRAAGAHWLALHANVVAAHMGEGPQQETFLANFRKGAETLGLELA